MGMFKVFCYISRFLIMVNLLIHNHSILQIRINKKQSFIRHEESRSACFSTKNL